MTESHENDQPNKDWVGYPWNYSAGAFPTVEDDIPDESQRLHSGWLEWQGDSEWRPRFEIPMPTTGWSHLKNFWNPTIEGKGQTKLPTQEVPAKKARTEEGGKRSRSHGGLLQKSEDPMTTTKMAGENRSCNVTLQQLP